MFYFSHFKTVHKVYNLTYLNRFFRAPRLTNTAEALDGSHVRHWHSDQSAWYVTRYSPPLPPSRKDREKSGALSDIQIWDGDGERRQRSPFAFTSHFRLCSLSTHFAKLNQNSKHKNQSKINISTILWFGYVSATRLATKRIKTRKEDTPQQWVLIRHRVPTELPTC
jgi:hypothetical protein